MVFDKKMAADLGMQNMANITVPDGVTVIAEAAFHKCEDLQSIVMPDSVTIINPSAFYGCYKLTDVRMSDNMKIIGEKAFAWCTNLQKIRMPDSVIELEYDAFYGCQNLMEINISNRIDVIKKGVFFGCKYLREITIPDGVTGIDKWAFKDCENLQRINIPDSVGQIHISAFTGCNKLVIYYTPSQIKYFGLFRKRVYVEKYFSAVKEKIIGKTTIQIKPVYSPYDISVKEEIREASTGILTAKQCIEAYIAKIARFGNLIDNDDILKEINEIKAVLEQMAEMKEIENWRKHLDSLFGYYFPALEKILNTYCEIADIKGAVETKEKISEVIPVIRRTFDEIRTNMYAGKMLDIETDIDALKAMLAQDSWLVLKVEK